MLFIAKRETKKIGLIVIFVSVHRDEIVKSAVRIYVDQHLKCIADGRLRYHAPDKNSCPKPCQPHLSVPHPIDSRNEIRPSLPDMHPRFLREKWSARYLGKGR